MTTREVLLKAAEIVERGWTQKFYARSADGTPTDNMDADAVCWCAEGAIRRASGDKGPLWFSAVFTLESYIGDFIVDWNDDPRRTQAEVIAALRKAADLVDGQCGVGRVE